MDGIYVFESEPYGIGPFSISRRYVLAGKAGNSPRCTMFRILIIDPIPRLLGMLGKKRNCQVSRDRGISLPCWLITNRDAYISTLVPRPLITAIYIA